MKAKHTPGPWRVHPEDVEKVIQSSQGVAVMSGMLRDTIEREANARLIASAPDLLAALKCCLVALETIPAELRDPGQMLMARAAIARAEGGAL